MWDTEIEIIHKNYSTLESFLDYSQQDHPNDGPDSSRSSLLVRPHFTLTRSKDEAYDLIRKGNPAGLERMLKILEALESNISLPATHDEFLSSVDGCAPNVEAYIQGIPEDMFVISQIEDEMPPSSLVVQLELTVSAMFSPTQIEYAGAILFAAAQALQMQGCAVQFILTYAMKDRGLAHITTIPLPRNTDLDTQSFLLTHPAMLRILMFSAWEHEPKDIRNRMGFWNGGGYGTPWPACPLQEGCDVKFNLQRLCLAILRGGTSIEFCQSLLLQLIETKFGMSQK
jgi:hypothetical protein